MSTALWIAAGVLAVAFLAAGLMKLTTSREQLVQRMPWANDFSQGQIRAISVAEILGAIGLILPAITGIATILVPLAATGLAIDMLGALIVHARRRDGAAAIIPVVVLGLLAVFVAWGRFGAYAF